jgi:hypothetical protein
VEFEEGVGKAYRYAIQGWAALLLEWIGATRDKRGGPPTSPHEPDTRRFFGIKR